MSLYFKELAGPPAEFVAMAPPDPKASALRSSTALLPVTLEPSGIGGFEWSSTISFESTEGRFLILAPEGSAFGESWRVTLRNPATGRDRSPTRLGKSSRTGLPGHSLPAELYHLKHLEAGPWQVRIASVREGQGFILIEGGGPARLVSYRSGSRGVVGERIGVVASLEEAPGEAIASTPASVAEALLRVTAPDGYEFTVPMRDDGSQQDGRPRDAVYGGTFVADKAGIYTAQVLVRGKGGDGKEFLRTSEHLIPVVRPSLALAADPVEGLQVSDRRLRLRLKVAAQQPLSHYRVFAEVWGTDPATGQTDVPVAWIGGMASVEEGGLPLGLDTRWIERSGAQGPLELRNVRVEDPRHFVTLSTADRLPMRLPERPEIPNLAEPYTIDEEMLMGPRPSFLDLASASPTATEALYTAGAGHLLLLIHGYCSSDVWGPVRGQFDNEGVFLDLNQNRSHDDFAQQILNAADAWNSYSIVAHSQGGMASLHLYNYYWSGLDNTGPGRLIQSVGTPYQGTPLAGSAAVLGDLFGAGCGTNSNLTTSGAASWLSGIASFARSAVNYYTTSFYLDFGNDYCSLVTDLLLDDPEDGVVEQSHGQLSGATNRGHEVGWCHSSGMRDPAQTTDIARNIVMNANAASGSQDLIVTGMTVSDTTLIPGQSFTAGATVYNQGSATSAATTMRYYRSSNSIISTADVQLSIDGVSTLVAGGSSPESDTESISSTGTYWIGACVDALPGEANSGNNCSSGVQVVVADQTQPDLVVTGLTVSDLSLDTGQSFTVGAAVLNQGSATSTSTTLRYYRSTNSIISTSDVQMSTDGVGSLSPGGFSAESDSATINVAGTYWIGACVDAISGESDTGNNCSSGVEVTVEAPADPDLVVESPAVSDSTPTSGQTFTASATVRNQGSDSASSTTLRYYRSTSSTISIGDTQIGTDFVSSLSAGQISSESESVTAPSGAGTYWIGACVDSVSGESVTSNNCSAGVRIDVSAASDCGTTQIANTTLSGSGSYSACDVVKLGPSVTVASTAVITIEAGGKVIFGDGVSVDDGGELLVRSCGQDLCSTGSSLKSGCHSCVSSVCSVDSYCCDTAWDSICVGEVGSVCGLTCP